VNSIPETKPPGAETPSAGASDPADYIRRNRAVWDKSSVQYAEAGHEAWASDQPAWGIWRVPEAELRALPDVTGKDALELGCGTAYWSAWLARRGARVVGLDNSMKQLASARRFQREFGLVFPLIHAIAEAAPLRDEQFDLILSEYGASIWSDPYRWIPEASRLLRPGGELVFLRNSTLLMLCTPPEGTRAEERLAREFFGMHRFEWPDDLSVEFHLSPGKMIRLLRRCGFTVEDLIEVRAPEGGTTRHTDMVTLDWARRWPCEEIWRARKGG
jgi:SAM-dependent methyltransferase